MSPQSASAAVPPAVAQPAKTLAVLLEPERAGSAQELLGAAAQIAARVAGRVVAMQVQATTAPTLEELSAWGADHLVLLQHAAMEEDVARGVGEWAKTHQPWAVLAPSTSWGRKVASRVAARLGAGLTGDAIDLDVDAERLVGWKPAFGGRLVAAIRATSPVQMVTVRPGVLPRLVSRMPARLQVEVQTVTPQTRLRILSYEQNDQLDALALAKRVVVWVPALPRNVMENCICYCECSTPNSPRPGKSQTITGCRIRARLASPDGVLPPICILLWPLAVCLIIPVAFKRRGRCWQSTRMPTRRFLIVPTSLSWRIGLSVCRYWWMRLRRYRSSADAVQP